MEFINLTSHPIVVLIGEDRRVFAPSGTAARVAITQEVVSMVDGIYVHRTVFGEAQGIPAPQEGVMYIASSLVAQAARRADVVAPDTGATAIRENGQVVAVRGFQTF